MRKGMMSKIPECIEGFNELIDLLRRAALPYIYSSQLEDI